jgi:hypothetical protein
VASGRTLVWHDPQMCAQDVFPLLGAETVSLREASSMSISTDLHGIAWITTESRDSARNEMLTIAKLVETGAKFLCVLEPVDTMQAMPTIPLIIKKGQGILSIAPAAYFQDLATSAETQWNFLQLWRAMRAPDTFPF